MRYIIPGPGSCAWVDDYQGFNLVVNHLAGDRWGHEYAWTVYVGGELLATRDSLFGPTEHAASALAVLTRCLVSDAERWRTTLHDGLCHEPFATTPDVARWAYAVGDPILAAAEATAMWASHVTE